MSKYKQQVDQLYAQYADELQAFEVVHTNYVQNNKKWKKKFDELGKPLMEILRDGERRLCSGMERGKYASYSAKLAEQYWTEIKKRFPLIELVGVELS